MARKVDIRSEFLKWDDLKNASPEAALGQIYGHAEAFSKSARAWYWHSIQSKRGCSIMARCVSLVLASFGVVAPLITVLVKQEAQLPWTQFAIMAFVGAGLAQLADRVFGWSTGWLRYITTITEMENLSRQFQLDWAEYLLSRRGAFTTEDIAKLFAIANRFERAMADQQRRETESWISEFNTSMAALNDVIQNPRDRPDPPGLESRNATTVVAQTTSVRQDTIALNREATIVNADAPVLGQGTGVGATAQPSPAR